MKNCQGEILAVLVLYRQELSATATFTSLSQSLEKCELLDLLVYDNSPASMQLKQNEDYTGWRVHYRHDPSNPGVSKAYNAGAQLARQLGKKWLLLLDQDTFFPENALAGYCQAVVEYPDITIFAPVLKTGDMICSPCRYWARTGFPLKSVTPGLQSFENRAVLNSGTLVSVDIFERCGGFDELIRLDFADFAFNNRLRQYCDSFYTLPIECGHGFSGAEALSLDDALRRFEVFSEGAEHSINNFTDAMLYRLVVLKRCLRLTFQFRSLRFMKALFRGEDKG